MKRTLFISIIMFFALSLIVGCSNGNAVIADWMQNLDEHSLVVYFWYNSSEKRLTYEEVQELVSITNNLSEDNFKENKHLAGITPEYGLRLVIDGAEYHINQSDAPSGETEINFQDKQWWIKSSDLRDFMLSLIRSFKEE